MPLSLVIKFLHLGCKALDCSNGTLPRQCLLDAYSLTQCPNCSTNLITPSLTGAEQIICTMNNEGGLQANLDIMPFLKEESYLKCYPEERKARALLEFCRQGDLGAVVDTLLNDDDEGSDDDAGAQSSRQANVADILRYQDPIGDMESALHAAVSGGSREVVWLLLLVSSAFDLEQFPPEVLQEAETLGITRGDMTGKTDIRGLKDAKGRSAEQVAAELGGIWNEWLGTGRLKI